MPKDTCVSFRCSLRHSRLAVVCTSKADRVGEGARARPHVELQGQRGRTPLGDGDSQWGWATYRIVCVRDCANDQVDELVRVPREAVPIAPAHVRVGTLALEEGVEQHVQVLRLHPPL
eukprot:scaffold178334_cov31-Tisochrysis_lutea.AAC.5